MQRFYSPLRYPGGKGKLADFIQIVFTQNFLEGGEYVEPYAGGASVALSLLFNEYIEKAHINDFDRAIFAFWHCVLYETEELCRRISDTPVTIAEWMRQKEQQESKTDTSLIDLGFSTFFLNRCNRSGIIKGGVIGGKNQTGKWKIDARFNKTDLISRIQRIARYKNRICIYNEDAEALTKKLIEELPPKTLFYFDPPYYVKGRDLYVNFYEHANHLQMCKTIQRIEMKHWLVSYDNQPEIKKMYQSFRQMEYSLHYHASKPTKGSEVVFFSDNLAIPDIESPVRVRRQRELWRT